MHQRVQLFGINRPGNIAVHLAHRLLRIGCRIVEGQGEGLHLLRLFIPGVLIVPGQKQHLPVLVGCNALNKFALAPPHLAVLQADEQQAVVLALLGPVLRQIHQGIPRSRQAAGVDAVAPVVLLMEQKGGVLDGRKVGVDRLSVLHFDREHQAVERVQRAQLSLVGKHRADAVGRVQRLVIVFLLILGVLLQLLHAAVAAGIAQTHGHLLRLGHVLRPAEKIGLLAVAVGQQIQRIAHRGLLNHAAPLVRVLLFHLQLGVRRQGGGAQHAQRQRHGQRAP